MPKIIKKHFDNPFQDFSPEAAVDKIYNYQVDKKCRISVCLKTKWEQTSKKFAGLDTSDYSVYTGTAGIALLKLLRAPDDKSNLAEVKNLLRLNHLKNRRVTFLCGDAGPVAIGAVVSHKLGDSKECKKLVDRLLHMQGPAINCKSDLPNEFLYGRAGYLFSLLYVNKHVGPGTIEDSVIRNVIDAILSSGQIEAKISKYNVPLMYQWHDSCYLGSAHGFTGIIYLLLQAHNYLTDVELNTLIKPTIEYLTILKFPSGNYPSSLGSDTDRYVQWCHGAPGFVFMYSEAFKVFKEKKYLELSLKSADVVWERGLVRKGYSMCHGVAGNAYCFLELYQTTKDVKHLYRAIKFAEWCVDYTTEREEYSPDRPLSLFEGISGPMYLLLDMQDPLNAKFPGFTL